MEKHKGEFDRIIVKFKDNISLRTKHFNTNELKKFEKYGKFKPSTTTNSNMAIIEPYDPEKVNWKEMIEYYDSLPEVKYAEPDYYRYLHQVPNDPYYNIQWNMKQINVVDSWNYTPGSSSVKVAVIDSGVAYKDDPNTTSDNGCIPDLAGTNFIDGYDYVNGDAIAYDDNNHGTHVTGTIAATANDNVGCVGVAPDITIIPFKAMNYKGVGYTFAIVSSIYSAVDEKGVNIINMSLGASTGSGAEEEAINYAYSKGVMTFVSTGNENTAVSYPAAYPNAIAVGATSYEKKRAIYSNYGPQIDIAAPGGDWTTPGDNNKWIWQQSIYGYNSEQGVTNYTFGLLGMVGTSMACPHAVGVAALLKSHRPSATNTLIEAVMKNTAEKIDSAEDSVNDSIFNDYLGFGLVKPAAGLELIESLVDSGITTAFNKYEIISSPYTEITTKEYQFDVLGGTIYIVAGVSGGSDAKDDSVLIELIRNGITLISSTNKLLNYDATGNGGTYTVKITITPIE